MNGEYCLVEIYSHGNKRHLILSEGDTDKLHEAFGRSIMVPSVRSKIDIKDFRNPLKKPLTIRTDSIDSIEIINSGDPTDLVSYLNNLK